VQRVSDNNLFDNWLIFGDNMLELKALEQEFTGKIKFVYIDCPYNTGSAFEEYNDGVHVGRLVDHYCSVRAAHPNPMSSKEMRTLASRTRRQPTSFPA
jgi:hypothetical protein